MQETTITSVRNEQYKSGLQTRASKVMSEAKKERPVVPEGKTEYVTTRQMKANEKGYVGYETEWVSFQKEVKYETPKKP